MTEAEITCTCLSIRLADLDVVLFKGQTVYVDEERAKASKDLETARRGNGVQVRYVERCEERRDPEPKPRSRMMARPTRRPTPVAPAKTQSPSPGLDVDVLADLLKDRLGGFVGFPINEQTRQMVREEVVSILNPVLESLMGAIQASPRRPEAGKVEKQGAAPVFIPDRIVGDGTQADISVDRDEADSGSVDAAAKALRVAKKKKKAKK